MDSKSRKTNVTSFVYSTDMQLSKVAQDLVGINKEIKHLNEDLAQMRADTHRRGLNTLFANIFLFLLILFLFLKTF